jgi:low temperature requirement protein LtrA
MTQEPTGRTEERSVSHFELFFDLVFVFSLTRVTALIFEEPTAFGVLRGLLVLALLWWAWGAYAWLTNAVDTNGAAARVVVLAAMGTMLVVAVAVPQASGRDALAFALGYLVVRVLHLVLYAVAGGANRAAILRLAPGNLFASVLLIVGVFLPIGIQVALWGLAVLVDYGTPLITGVGGFAVQAGHFFERHALFMIIALGESVVAVGVGVLHGNAAITPLMAVAVVLALGTVGGMWWAYFDWEAGLNLRELYRAQGAIRAHLARDLFSYLHLPLVIGVVFVAVGLEGVMQHPLDPLHGIHQISLGGGAALFLIGLGAVRARRGHRARLDHLLGGAVCLGLIPLATLLPAIVALVILLLVLMVIALVDRTRRDEPAASTENPVGAQ